MRVWGTGLLKGMSITMKNMLRGPITVQYPHDKIELPQRARWAVRPRYNEDGTPKCTACLACVRACPDYILDMQVTTREDRSKHIDGFRYELGACMMCGLCVEACPFDALEMSHDYELARRDPSELTYDLLEDVDAAAPKRDKAAAVPKPRPVASSADSAAAAERSTDQGDVGGGPREAQENEGDGADG